MDVTIEAPSGTYPVRDRATGIATNYTIPTLTVAINQTAPVVGNTLTLTTNADSDSTFQWRRNGSNISGATSTSYIAILADQGQLISCRVVSGTQTVTSTAVTVDDGAAQALQIVGDGTNNWRYEIQDNSEGDPITIRVIEGGVDRGSITVTQAQLESGAVFNLQAPIITETNVDGTFSVDTGIWLYPQASAPSLTVQWRRDGTSIGSATGLTYVSGALDEETDLTCAVTLAGVTVVSNIISIPSSFSAQYFGNVLREFSFQSPRVHVLPTPLEPGKRYIVGLSKDDNITQAMAAGPDIADPINTPSVGNGDGSIQCQFYDLTTTAERVSIELFPVSGQPGYYSQLQIWEVPLDAVIVNTAGSARGPGANTFVVSVDTQTRDIILGIALSTNVAITGLTWTGLTPIVGSDSSNMSNNFGSAASAIATANETPRAISVQRNTGGNNDAFGADVLVLRRAA